MGKNYYIKQNKIDQTAFFIVENNFNSATNLYELSTKIKKDLVSHLMAFSVILFYVIQMRIESSGL